ncbi:hypothetical protein CSUI_004820 [Cystoisospora suis]|uniref:Transmembrane protein n=1 Tax=Cystoisospora suis TaxID=483139 RepID=A0A2C6KVY6_9APIC|nr:hypothetical protein CSUI_004820 [Cystoisospora suis]
MFDRIGQHDDAGGYEEEEEERDCSRTFVSSFFFSVKVTCLPFKDNGLTAFVSTSSFLYLSVFRERRSHPYKHLRLSSIFHLCARPSISVDLSLSLSLAISALVCLCLDLERKKNERRIRLFVSHCCLSLSFSLFIPLKMIE